MKRISKDFYVTKTAKEFDKLVDTLFQHYRREGFPYFPTNSGYRDVRFAELMNADTSEILRNNIITRTTQGTNLAWSYFPHAFKVKCGTMRTPYECFADDVALRGTIAKALRMTDNFNDSTLRGMIRNYQGTQSVSNFRPTAASALYDYYAPKGVVWDMSGGWGGRLLGAIRSDLKQYIATEPSTLTHKGLNELAIDYWKKGRFKIWKLGSEVHRPDKNSLDFCFTSPPYFDLEKYSDESTQSFKQFKTKDAWADGFLRETFENCRHGLKNGKYMAINIADPKQSKGISLESETVRVAKDVGFMHVNTILLMLKAPLGSKQLYKYEPVFIFKK